MRLQRAVSYSSLAVILFTALVIGSTPFRIPHSTIAWLPMAVFVTPAIVLLALLLVRPLLPLSTFRVIVAVVAVLGTAAMMLGWISLFILCLLFVALVALYIQGGLHARS